MNKSHDKNHICGVKCVVNSCKYHANDNCCTAKGIEIKSNCCSSNTCSSEQTDCATFEPLN